MKYSKDEILGMDKETFVHTFKRQTCVITTDANEMLQGLISQIGLSAMPNLQTNEYLPVDVKVNGRTVRIYEIKFIELIP